MDEIDKAVILADFMANKKECCLCKRLADDVYIAKFEDVHKTLTISCGLYAMSVKQKLGICFPSGFRCFASSVQRPDGCSVM